MKDLLEQGKVPSEPIFDALKNYVDTQNGDVLAILEGVSVRSGVPYDTLETWYSRPERVSSLRFGTADSLLCAMGLWNLWYSELEDIYQNVDLNWKQCEREGCRTWFNVGPRENHHFGKRRRRYCTQTCGQMSWLQETGKIEDATKYNRRTHCRNGHKRSEYGKNAAGNCKGCVDEANARMRLKHAEKRRAYQKKWYAANKEKKVEYQRRWREKRRIEGVAA